VDLQVDADVSEKHADSIFRGSSDKIGKQRAYIGLEEIGLREEANQREGILNRMCPESSLLVHFPYSLPLHGSLPSVLALHVLYKPTTSLLCHFMR
jgi:hypothetical protein